MTEYVVGVAKQLVELPSGTWIDVESIESIEATGVGTQIFMKSGRCHRVTGENTALVRYRIKHEWNRLDA